MKFRHIKFVATLISEHQHFTRQLPAKIWLRQLQPFQFPAIIH